MPDILLNGNLDIPTFLTEERNVVGSNTTDLGQDCLGEAIENEDIGQRFSSHEVEAMITLAKKISISHPEAAFGQISSL